MQQGNTIYVLAAHAAAGQPWKLITEAFAYYVAGKLFPGPHLFAGAAIVALWAVAAALVPAMQKGNQNARNAHIALNAVNVGLFIWQVSSNRSMCPPSCKFCSYYH